MLGHNRRITGAQCLADMLNGYGVTHVFMVPAVLRRALAEMERRTAIKRIHAHGEKAAAYMADGYARASGKPGICMAQVIGALNLAAGLRDAFLAHAPVIALTGGREPKTKFRKVYQEIDDVPAFEPVTKFNATVDDVARFPDMVRQAFRVAVSGTPGPVHLQFRGNEGQIDAEEAEMEPLIEKEFTRVPPFRPQPDAGSIAATLALLAQAERPVIVAGGGVRASGAQAELVALAEALQIPVATSLNGKDSIPGTHPLSVGVVGTYSRESANRVVNGADLVCFVGTETGGMTTHFWEVPKIGTPAIQIDIEPEALGRNYPLQAGILGDAKVTLTALNARADRTSATGRQPWIAQAQALCHDWSKNMRPRSPRTRHRSGPSESVATSPGLCPKTPSSWSTPDMLACGWAACSISQAPSKAICAAPDTQAGHFRPGSGPNARARSARWSCSLVMPVFGITSPRSRPRRAGASIRLRWSTTTPAVTSPSVALTVPMAANKPSRRVNCGLIAR